MNGRRYVDGHRKLRKADKPRRTVYDVLHEVETQGAFANIILPEALCQARRDDHFSDRDVVFTSELVHGMLCVIGRLDWVISRHIGRPPADLDPRTLVVLCMSTHQLLDMRAPDHAVVSAIVDVAREHLTDGPMRFVSTMLCSITREDPSERETAMDAIVGEDQALDVRYLYSTWMVTAFHDALRAHGYPEEELLDVLEVDNEVPTATLVARPSLMSIDGLVDEAEDILDTRVTLGAVSPYVALPESGDPTRLPSVRGGRVGVQDESSQFVALITASASPEDDNDECWLDLCAGPGGKAALLAGLAADVGVHVTANEVHSHRVRLVEHMTRQFDSTEVVSGDGHTFDGDQSAWPLGSFDCVVVDTPCPGMGLMRRRPESRWNRTPASVEGLIVLQREPPDRAVALTRPGGVLTHTTCSSHAAETREQVERLLKAGEVELLDTVVPANECTPQALDVSASVGVIKGLNDRIPQLWDHRFGTDLIFVACLCKRQHMRYERHNQSTDSQL